MSRKRKGETSEEALERVYNKHVSIPKGLNLKDFTLKVKDQLTGNAESLKELVKGKVAEDLYKSYQEEAQKTNEDYFRAGKETKEQKEARKKQEAIKKREQGKKVFKEKVSSNVKKHFQVWKGGTRAVSNAGKIIITKQKSKKGKEYSRSYQIWTPQQNRFIQSRKNNTNNKQLAKEFNETFGTNRSVSSIKTKKIRLRKQN